MQLVLPFSSKDLPDGRRLFRRKHGYQLDLEANGVSTLDVVVPYAVQKVNEVEIIGAEQILKCNLKVKDTAAGTYSGVPNFVLNQFGFNVFVAKDYFKDISPYDAELLVGMRIVIEITNPGAAHTIGLNVVFHEVKTP